MATWPSTISLTLTQSFPYGPKELQEWFQRLRQQNANVSLCRFQAATNGTQAAMQTNLANLRQLTNAFNQRKFVRRT
jgi:sulfur relay (sulfurtransferase) complex TusBCD TusD component (DsrE family)